MGSATPVTWIPITDVIARQGEPWEQDHIARAAIDTLRAAAGDPVDENFWRLRTRLIELRYPEAAKSLRTRGPTTTEVALDAECPVVDMVGEARHHLFAYDHSGLRR